MTMHEAPRRPGRRRASTGALVVREVLATLGELARMVWSRRMWWAVPALLTLVVVGVLVLVSATPVAPLFYPLF